MPRRVSISARSRRATSSVSCFSSSRRPARADVVAAMSGVDDDRLQRRARLESGSRVSGLAAVVGRGGGASRVGVCAPAGTSIATRVTLSAVVDVARAAPADGSRRRRRRSADRRRESVDQAARRSPGRPGRARRRRRAARPGRLRWSTVTGAAGVMSIVARVGGPGASIRAVTRGTRTSPTINSRDVRRRSIRWS